MTAAKEAVDFSTLALLFGLMILVIFRMATVTRARALLFLAFVASLPPTILLLASGHFYTPWSWLPRIVAQFLAGALACAAVRRLRLTDRSRRAAGRSCRGSSSIRPPSRSSRWSAAYVTRGSRMLFPPPRAAARHRLSPPAWLYNG